MKHKVVRKAVRMFAEAELGPIAHDIDRDARFPWEVVEKMQPLQLFGLQTAKAYGGAEMDSISYAIAIEEISRVSAAVGLCLTVHNGVGIFPIERFGTEEQKIRFLPAMTSGERIGAFCLTEANAGSDAGGVETVAVRDGDDYVINGTKVFMTDGGVWAQALIVAVTDPVDPQKSAGVFVVERDTPGTVSEIENLWGMRANPVSSFFWRSAASRRPTCWAAPATGSRSVSPPSTRAASALPRRPWGSPRLPSRTRSTTPGAAADQKNDSSFQTIQNYLADMETEIDAARLLLYRACAVKDAGRPFGAERRWRSSTQAGLPGSRASPSRSTGGTGRKEYDVERYFRNAKVTEIYEGTSDMQRWGWRARCLPEDVTAMVEIIMSVKQVPLVSELPWDPQTGTLQRDLAEGMMNPTCRSALEAACGSGKPKEAV